MIFFIALFIRLLNLLVSIKLLSKHLFDLIRKRENILQFSSSYRSLAPLNENTQARNSFDENYKILIELHFFIFESLYASFV